ncbi:helix-turn-helix transcriptional regulator [Vibrio alginolyticus]|uniref:helix-turn-helix transcriptional regulator n=1 Tax=Vibrio alginolyticus TaxID=663 RepID=UPI001BD60017|nr:AlpA family transcriptional regulator [Vibrio alginolyticus]MBS9824352.1 AlpA family transcriptional regulator [Vibrio alginolyticus]HCH1025269.1 AlpA family transcriptional regulator [Vibrio parahaemolyticus]
MTNHLKERKDIDRIIPMKEVSQILGRSLKSIWRWHSKDKIMPAPLKVNGRAIGYRASTLEAFLNSLEAGE